MNTIVGHTAKSGSIAGDSGPFPDELNEFSACFEQKANKVMTFITTDLSVPVSTVTVAEGRSVFQRMNSRKATDPDGAPGCVLRTCMDQLAGVLTDIFNLALLFPAVPACLKKT